jgi:hypothetical protein
MPGNDLVTWEVWYPKAASTGLLHARGRLDPAGSILVHAVPDFVTVDVRDAQGNRIAFGQDLERTLQSPMCRLTIAGDAIQREDLWPTDSDLGLPVLLPGGEVGILKSWWNAGDRKEWRWQIELYNSIR